MSRPAYVPSAANRNPEDAGRRKANKDTTAVKIKARRHKGAEGEICEFKIKHYKFNIAFPCF